MRRVLDRIRTMAPSESRSDSDGGGSPGRLEMEHLLEAELSPALQIVRGLGDETFGSLYLAKEPALQRDVVVKVLRPEYAANREARLRFTREATAAANIVHPNVVQVFANGALSNGVPFVVQPYLGDCTLKDRLNALGPFEAPKVRHVLGDLASALAAAHGRGILHRDVRPETVRCHEPSDRVILIDFGMAGIMESSGLEAERITWSQGIVMSLGALSPEYSRGEPLTDRIDVYGLGALGWRLLAGADAAIPLNRTAAYWRSFGQQVADPDLVDLIRRCMADRPTDRPRAVDVMNELAAGGDRLRSTATNRIADLIERRIPHVGFFLCVVGTLLGVVTDASELALRPLLLLGAFSVSGVLAILVGTWFHGKKGSQKIERLERWLYGVIVVTWLVVSGVIWILTPG